MLRGMVCDVGHVVSQGSVLNHVLKKIGRADKATLLYDPIVLQGGSPEAFDATVRSVMTEKIEALRGMMRPELAELLSDVPLTDGLAELVEFARSEGLELVFVGAVPATITRMLLERALPCAQSITITGSSIDWHQKQLTGATWVCTPGDKREVLLHWMSERGLRSECVAYIGDSIGDIAAMSVLPRQNRIAFNAASDAVLRAAGHAFKGSFRPVIDCLRQNLCGSAEAPTPGAEQARS